MSKLEQLLPGLRFDKICDSGLCGPGLGQESECWSIGSSLISGEFEFTELWDALIFGKCLLTGERGKHMDWSFGLFNEGLEMQFELS